MAKTRIWITLIVIMILIAFAISVGAGLIYLMQRPVSVQRGSTLEISLGGSVSEFPAQDPLSELFAPSSQNLWELRKILLEAADDKRVSSIYLEVYPLGASWAQVEELREMMIAFRESGKKIYAFYALDVITERELYLGSAVDHLAMNPTAGLLVNGFMAEVFFMKRTMDKLGVKPHFIQLKEFKSPETYTRQNMTPEIKEMYVSILSELQNRFVETVCQDRGIDKEAFLGIMNVGLGTAQSAVETNLVDEIAYRSEVKERIRNETEGGEYEPISASDYLESIDSSGSERVRIALVGAFGTITSGRSESFSGIMGGSTISSRLRDVRENDDFDGVILRVDSPGGSAVGSDMVWREVRNLEEAGKPVVVSMSGVAGSGGYYISMGASRIVSQPSTITGSIGVIFGKFDLSGFYDWLGMDIERIKLAENADLFSFYSSLTDAQRESVLLWMEETYKTFVRKAAEGRGMEYDELEAKAHGRIYTGAQAKETGLVDELGGLPVAIAEMRELLDLSEEVGLAIELYPKPKTLLETLASGDLLKLEVGAAFLEQMRFELKALEQPKLWMLTPQFDVE